jgi:hypothetical protein
MDTLSMIGLVTRQRETYFKQAERLAKKFPDLSQLEQRMEAEARVIVKGLRDRQMKFEEYERALIDKTLTSALAALYLGAGDSQPKQKMETAWPSIVGDMLPPLNVFLKETKDYIDEGVLKYGDDSVDFAEEDKAMENQTLMSILSPNTELDPDFPERWLDTSPAEQAAIETAKRSAVGRTWRSLLGRVLRYVASPAYGFFETGLFMRRKQEGHKEMRRIARHDSRVCPDCINYDEAGWQPIGSLPMPGHGCRCYDRCRCRIEYR